MDYMMAIDRNAPLDRVAERICAEAGHLGSVVRTIFNGVGLWASPTMTAAEVIEQYRNGMRAATGGHIVGRRPPTQSNKILRGEWDVPNAPIAVITHDDPRQRTVTLSAEEIARRLMDMLEREGAMHMSSLVRELELCGMAREQNSGA